MKRTSVLNERLLTLEFRTLFICGQSLHESAVRASVRILRFRMSQHLFLCFRLRRASAEALLARDAASCKSDPYCQTPCLRLCLSAARLVRYAAKLAASRATSPTGLCFRVVPNLSVRDYVRLSGVSIQRNARNVRNETAITQKLAQ